MGIFIDYMPRITYLYQSVKQNNGLSNFTSEKYPLHQQTFWWFRFSILPLMPRYLKNVQNETIRHISVGNTLGYYFIKTW